MFSLKLESLTSSVGSPKVQLMGIKNRKLVNKFDVYTMLLRQYKTIGYDILFHNITCMSQAKMLDPAEVPL